MALTDLISAENLELLRKVFLFCGAGSFALAVVSIALLWMRPRDDEESPARASESDLANMMILLQTMRDLLAQQKDLARQLNDTLDKKVEFVRETVDAAMADLDTLRESMGKTAHGLAGVNASIAELQEQAAQIRAEFEEAGRKPAAAQPQGSAAGQAELELPKQAPELQVFRQPDRPQVNPDLLSNWVGLDLGEEEEETGDEEIPEEVPEAPDNPEAVREAFKTLLDLQTHKNAPPPSPAAATESAAKPPADEAASSGNGRGRVTPLQARVYEYRDAGMTISEIAKEIGIGKGEVRLILSIRERA